MKKRSLITMGLLGLLSTTSILGWSAPSEASNSSVEAGLQSFGDLSMFYQALLNTGVINELKENEEYTIFAPVNTAFAQIPRVTYPCFYSEQCRPQIAALVRDHIVIGHHELPELVTYGRGIQADGQRRIHVEELYVNDYAVESQKILSKSEIGGSVIYRIDGVVTTPQELAQFQNVAVVPIADTVTTEKTIIKKTYRNPSALPQAYPAGSMMPVAPAAALPNDASETTTIIDTTTPNPY